MKKLLALLLTVLMITSLMPTVTFAANFGEVVLWEEDFESVEQVSDVAAAGGTCTGNLFIQKSSISAYGALSDNILAAKRNVNATASANNSEVVIRMKVPYTDLKEGHKYVFTARVMHKDSAGAKAIKTQVVKDNFNAYDNNASTKTYNNVPELKWISVKTGVFTYDPTKDDATTGVNVRILLSSGNVATTAQRLYVDDVKFIEVPTETIVPSESSSVFANYKLGETFDFEDLEYNALRTYKASDASAVYDTDSNGVKYLTADPVDADNTVLRLSGSLDYASNTPRNELAGFLAGEENLKAAIYKVSYKLYPMGISTQNIRTGIKGEIGSATAVGSLSGVQLVNGEDFKANQWNDISFEVQTISDISKNLFVDQRVGVAGDSTTEFIITDSFEWLFIDDIKIELIKEGEGSYFADMASDEAVIKDFEENPTLQTGSDYKSGSEGFGTLSIANEGYNSNYSLKISGRTQTTGRYKLLDAFKNAQLGSMWKISAYVKIAGANTDVTPLVSLSAMSNETYYDMQIARVEAKTDEWTKVELIYIVSEDYQGNKMDEIAISQELYGGDDQKKAVDTIYIDDLCVEPVDDSVAAVNKGSKHTKGSNGANTSYRYNAMSVKFSVPTALSEGTIIIVAAYDKDNNLIGNDAFTYDGETTSYCYYIDNLSTLDMAKAKVFTFDGTNLSALNTAINLK